MNRSRQSTNRLVTRYMLANLLLVALSLAPVSASPISFSTDIAPLLEARCLACHQENIQKGDLSLATRKDLLASGKVTPGDTNASRLLRVLEAGPKGEAPEMPKQGPPLTEEEVVRIREWIAAGVPWEEGRVLKEPSDADLSWWSLQPIADVQPPEVPNAPAAWRDNPVDRFLYAGMVKKNLSPSPQADRRTLIRRLYFDLLGLPPTMEAISAFEADDRPDAYTRLVDELLASPHYGERWARHWLDIAHYADTHGFERDRPRDNAWRYRDYVIRAFNDDKPYDQFLREQIAGDILHPESRDAVVATGFLAAGPWDLVGQVETKSAALRRLARADDLDDMVTTVITATLGLTINCARCHDHKLDPIPQADYYRLSAVFAGTTRGDRNIDAAWDRAQERLAEIQRELGALDPAPIDLVDIVAGGDGAGTGRPYPAGINPAEGSAIDAMTGGLPVEPNIYTAVPAIPAVDGVFVPDGQGGQPVPITSTGIQLTELPDTAGSTWDYVLNGPVSSQDVTQVDGKDFAAPPNRLLGFHANKGLTFDLAAIRNGDQGDRFRFRADVAYGGKERTRRADVFLYVDGELRAARRGFGIDDGALTIEFDIATDERFLTLIATDGGDGIGHDQVFFGNPRLNPRAGSALSPEQETIKAGLLAEQARLLATHPPNERPAQVYATTAQALPETRIHLRGSPETPGDIVTPGALSCLTMLEKDLGNESLTEGERRAKLAAWTTAPENPLTRRVWVNRLWHYHFGTGIVDTPSDFGFGGGRPSHPALLDWLANELLEEDWSTKALHRLIVTSEAYRQQSFLSEDYPAGYTDPRSTDADNRLLWRMNPRRLPAEAVRDAVLSAAGTMNDEMYGPGFRDFDFEEEYAPKYHYITADRPELWRRSIYRFVVRSTPQPFMTTLDCPNPAVLTPDRLTTTTALQSLALLNNDFMLQQAELFAQRVAAETENQGSTQVTSAFQRALGRNPSAEEATASQALVNDRGLPALCRVLFNANEFVHID